MIVDVTSPDGESLLPQLVVEDQVNFRLKADQNHSVQLGHAVAFLTSPGLVALLGYTDAGKDKGMGFALHSAVISAAQFIDLTLSEDDGDDDDDDVDLV